MNSHSKVTARQRASALVFAMLGAFGPPAHAAATYQWPNLSGIGACQATLQACIDAAAPGDTVLIGNDELLLADGYTVVDEDIAIAKSLNLAGAAGIDAVFAPGRRINVDSPTSGAVNVDIEHLVLRHGQLRVTHRSDTASSYTLSRLRIEETNTNTGEGAIQVSDAGAGPAHVVVGDNVIELTGATTTLSAGIGAYSLGGEWHIDVFRNRVHLRNVPATAIAISAGGFGSMAINDNVIDGSGYQKGIRAAWNPGSAANSMDVLDNVVLGARGPAGGEASMMVALTNTALRLVNNTVVGNILGVEVSRFGSDSSSGRVANNLVAFNTSTGLAIDSGLAGAVSNGYNLVHGNGGDSFTPGPGTVSGDPLLTSMSNPRPSSLASPAVDAGNTADVPTTLFGYGFDADGESRVVAGVDIGAYELSIDRSGTHRSTTANVVPGGDYTWIDEPIWMLASNAVLLATPLRASSAGTESANTLGVFEDDGSPSHWSIFHESAAPLSMGRGFSVFAPIDSRTHYVHTSNAGNSSANYTMLDDAGLNGHPEAVAFVTHNWNPGGIGGTYHDHRIGLEYFGSHWYVRNEDLADMAIGVSFNVVVTNLFTSQNWMVAQVGAVATPEVRLEHPLLDDNPCVAVQVTRSDGNGSPGTVLDDVPFVLDYRAGVAGAPGHWYIQTAGPGSPAFPAHAAFNVMAQGAQGNPCRDDRIFADDFDG